MISNNFVIIAMETQLSMKRFRSWERLPEEWSMSYSSEQQIYYLTLCWQNVLYLEF